MRRWPVFGAGLAVLWLFVRSVDLTPEVVAGEFLIGLLVGLPTAFLFRRFYRPEIDLGARIRGLQYVVVYLAVFLWELLTANVDVAYRVLSPSMPITPEVFEVPLRVESDAAITTIANSITLTPGTLTMDYDDQRNALYVHAIDGSNRQSVVEPIRSWEDYALVIFDEPRDPSDPVPAPARTAAGSAIDPGPESTAETDRRDDDTGRSEDTERDDGQEDTGHESVDGGDDGGD